MQKNEKTLGFFAVIFLTLGCLPAYFNLMFYAIILWMIGFALMNVNFFVLSHNEKF